MSAQVVNDDGLSPDDLLSQIQIPGSEYLSSLSFNIDLFRAVLQNEATREEV
jgi:hypothetical protein